MSRFIRGIKKTEDKAPGGGSIGLSIQAFQSSQSAGFKLIRKYGMISAIAVFWSAAVVGLLIKAPVNAITPPTILGELSYQKYQTLNLADQEKLLVNVADGNLILESHDMNIKGVDLNFAANRYYNSLSSFTGIAGLKNTMSFGKDVSITANADGSATYQGPSGFQVTFPSDGAGGYTVPSSYTDGKLSAVSGGGWKLTFNKSNEVYTFDSTGKQTQDTSANGLSITYNYNASGKLTSVTDTQGKTVTLSYYGNGKLEEIDDPTTRSVFYNYTGNNLTDYSDISGNDWLYGYTSGNLLNSITDPNGGVISIQYDASNRVSSITLAYGTTSAATYSYTYNNSSAQTVVGDPLSHNTTYTYDNGGRVTATQNAVGDTNSATWDANNNQTASIDPANNTTTYSYNSSNNDLTNIQNPTLASGASGANTSYAYTDTLHPYLPSSKTNAQGNIASFSYNTSGNIISATNAGVASTTTHIQGDSDGSGGTYNCSGKTGQICASITAGQTTSYTYDANGNATQIARTTGGTDTLTYDTLSRVKTDTDANGSKVTYSYDDYDRVTDAVYQTGGRHLYYEYDGNGNLTIVSGGGSGETDYTYDLLNRVTRIHQQQGTSSTYKNINYTYDKANNMKTEVGDAGTVTYSYDNANQLTGVNQSSTGTNYTFAYTNGRPTTVGIPGGITQTIGYDNDGREVSIKAVKGSTTLTDYQATYTNASGADSELMQSEKNNVTGITTTYGYDSLDRLTSATGSTGTGSHTYTYAYDNDGNMTQSNTENTSTSISYNGEELNVKSGPSESFIANSYDSVGNTTGYRTGPITSPVTSLTYTPQNQLATYTPAGGSTLNASYLDSTQNGRTSFGSTTYTNSLLGLYGEKNGTVNTYYLHVPGGTAQTIGQVIGANAYYYLQDLHGSTVAMTNASGSVVNTYTYDPYGKTIASSGTTSNAIQFQNAYFDTQSSLYKMGTRYYNSNEARFTQVDPTGKSFYYTFANDNPVNYSDPTGEFSTTQLLDLCTIYYGGVGVASAAAAAVLAGSGVGAPIALALGIGAAGDGAIVYLCDTVNKLTTDF